MRRPISRREMLQRSALTGVGFWVGTSPRRAARASASEKLDIAVIGIGGRGRANLNAVGGENIVALCDVQDSRAGDAYRKFPKATKYWDYRRLLDDLHSKIDAVVVSTPDHSHFLPAYSALQLGKHVYLEKPMAHSVWEARQITDLARRKKLATQLGVQRHTHDNVHRVVELIRSGAIGEVRECHSWVDSSRGMPAIPTEFPPVPKDLKWDLWLGSARARPYSPAYCPYNWRFWWDFGTGETGNWGCHILDIPFWALELAHPVKVSGDGPPPHPQTSTRSLHARFEFPARGKLPPVTLHWYQAKGGPPIIAERNLPRFGSATLFVGSKGMLLANFGKRKLFPEEKFKDFKPPAKSIPDSPGFHREWIEACKGGPRPTCHFDYSGPMAETVLLGNVAYRAQTSFTWNVEKLEARGGADVSELIHPPFRKGWEV